MRTPVQQMGMKRLVVDGDIAKAVVAAAREAMNNIDRHAHATMVTISVGVDRIAIRDDGVGFDPHSRAQGHHGLTESIIGLHRATLDEIAVRFVDDARITPASGAA